MSRAAGCETVTARHRAGRSCSQRLGARTSKAAILAVILASLVPSGCAPIHLGWSSEAEFGHLPSRLVRTDGPRLVLSAADAGPGVATLDATVCVVRHYERDTAAEGDGRFRIEGSSWTLGFLVAALGVLGLVDGGEDMGTGAAVFVLIFIGGFVAVGLLVDTVWFLGSFPVALVQAVAGAGSEQGTVSYALEDWLPCSELTLSDPATQATILVHPETGGHATLRAEQLKLAGFVSQELDVDIGPLHARFRLPDGFAKDIGAR